MTPARLLSSQSVELRAGDEYSFALADNLASEIRVEGASGLISTDGGYVQILTGQRAGVVAVTAEKWTGAPPALAETWEDIVEFSLDTNGPLRVSGSLVDTMSKPHVILAPSPGRFRVRVAAQGRDAGGARNNVVPWTAVLPSVEFFVIQCWPTDALLPAVTVKSTSAVSRQFES